MSDISATFIGTATVLLRLGAFTLLTDPNFLHRGQRAYLGYGMWSKRRTEPALTIGQLPQLDGVVLSHLHGDHFDRVAREGLPRDVPIVTTRPAQRKLRKWRFTEAVGFDTWDHQEWRRAGDRPAGLALSRQNLPVFDRTRFGSAEGVARGGYVLAEASGGSPRVILMGTGSEVQIAVAARETLEADGVSTRVVSLPCWEWFAAQDRGYREQVLPPSVRARVSVEAGVSMGWREFVGDAGRIVGLNHYGASAAYAVLYEQFGLTADAVVTAARESLAAVEAPAVAPTGPDSVGVLHTPTGDR
jgi:L-ascorbate metabolism protein UlaG (beta-lactamase superfamily)